MPKFRRLMSKNLDADEVEMEAHLEDIRQQLSDQLRCLDQKLECQVGMVVELQDFFRKRADAEYEYSKKLDQIQKNFTAKHKAEKQKREQWGLYSTFPCYTHLLNAAKKESRDHSILGDIYGTQMTARLQDTAEDLRRIFAQCRDIGMGIHEEIGNVLLELQHEMKSYHILYGESKQAEEKLKTVEMQRAKVEAQASKNSKKAKALDKVIEKKQAKHTDAKVKSVRSRNEYLIATDAANASLHKYFVDDLPLLIDCMELGYHNSMQRNMMMYKSCLESLQASAQTTVEGVSKCVQDLEPTKDKQAFIAHHSATFTLPKKFEFMPHRGDGVTEVSAEMVVQTDLQMRYTQLQKRLELEKLESEEIWKSVEATDKSLVAMIHQMDYYVQDQFVETPPPRSPANLAAAAGSGGTATTPTDPKPPDQKKKKLMETEKRQEMERYYFEKFRVSLSKSNQIARMGAKYDLLKKALEKTEGWTREGGKRPPSLVPAKNVRNAPRRLGKTPFVGQRKLFGSNLEEYIEESGREIPLVVTSCIRAIREYGLHHEGVFRISGLQSEINDFKASFEKGEDPLAHIEDGNSINSIAAVLKLFFRELQEPLFPPHLFDVLMECNRSGITALMSVKELRELVTTSFSRERRVVMRYLFAFLNHLSEKYDENLMAPYNLAVCFGPTLLPIPGDKDQVIFQNNVNEIIKLIIVYQADIFPKDDPGPIYEKIEKMDGDMDMSDDEENGGEEEETDVIEAVAVYAFKGRSEKELSFNKGDNLLLFKRITTDWWEGAFDGKEGMVPDNYVTRKLDADHDTKGRGHHTLGSVGKASSDLHMGMSASDLGKSPSHPDLQHSATASAPVVSAPLSSSSSALGSSPAVTAAASASSLDVQTPKTPPPALPSAGDESLFQSALSLGGAPAPASSPLESVPEVSAVSEIPTSSVENDLVTSLQELSNLTHSLSVSAAAKSSSADGPAGEAPSSTADGDASAARTTASAAASSAAVATETDPNSSPRGPASTVGEASAAAAAAAAPTPVLPPYRLTTPKSPSAVGGVSTSKLPSVGKLPGLPGSAGGGPASPRGLRSQPDLVIDLPDATSRLKKVRIPGITEVVTGSAPNANNNASAADTADTFANTEQNTVLRNSAKSASLPHGVSPAHMFAPSGASAATEFGGGSGLVKGSSSFGPVSAGFKRSASAKQTHEGKPMAVAERIPHDVVRGIGGGGAAGVRSPSTTPSSTPSGTPLATPTESKSFDMGEGSLGAKPKPGKVPPPTKTKPVRPLSRPKKSPDGATPL